MPGERLALRAITGLSVLGLGGMSLAGCGREATSIHNRVVAEATTDGTRHFATDGSFSIDGLVKTVTAHVTVRCSSNNRQIFMQAETLVGSQSRLSELETIVFMGDKTCRAALGSVTEQEVISHVNHSLNFDGRGLTGDGPTVDDPAAKRQQLIGAVVGLQP